MDSTNLAKIVFINPVTGISTTFEAALDAKDSNGHIISYDAASDVFVSGLLRKQDTTAFLTSKITGNYAFGFVGVSGNPSSRFAMAGEFTSNGSGTLSGEVDVANGEGWRSALSASDFAVTSTGAQAGRGTVSITCTDSQTMNFVVYVVSASEMLFMEDDNSPQSDWIPLTAGQALQQSGTFTDASLDGVSVIELETFDGTTPSVTAGLVTTTGNGATYTLSADQNQGGTMGTQSDTGTFSVSSDGRVSLLSNGSLGGSAPVLYLVAQNQAFVVGTNGGRDFGMMTPQTGSNFDDSSLSGNYLGGSQMPVEVNVNEEVDYVNASIGPASGIIAGTADKNNVSGGPTTNTINATSNVASNGRVILSQSGTPVLYLYIISPSQVVALPVSNTNPNLIDFHQ